MDQQTRGTHDNSSDVGQITRETRHTPASAPRGRCVAVRAQPLQPPLRCRLRRTKRHHDFLGAAASCRHALHGDTLLCGSQHVLRRLENTCDLRKMWLLVYGYVIKSVTCVSVQYGKMC